ncbi:MAG: hypothetical protein Kow00133_12060 [Amphiplicatus sp.]
MLGMLTFWRNPGRKIVANLHRYRTWKNRREPIARLIVAWTKFEHIFWSVVTTSHIRRDAEIHPSVHIVHPFCVGIHRDSIIGENCIIMQQVTIGQAGEGGVPVLGKNVFVGAGARILGPVTIGDNARIGANAVVLKDVPADATAVGVPARIILRKVAPRKPAAASSARAK